MTYSIHWQFFGLTSNWCYLLLHLVIIVSECYYCPLNNFVVSFLMSFNSIYWILPSIFPISYFVEFFYQSFLLLTSLLPTLCLLSNFHLYFLSFGSSLFKIFFFHFFSWYPPLFLTNSSFKEYDILRSLLVCFFIFASSLGYSFFLFRFHFLEYFLSFSSMIF